MTNAVAAIIQATINNHTLQALTNAKQRLSLDL